MKKNKEIERFNIRRAKTIAKVYEFDWLLVVLSPIILPIDFIMGVIRGKHD